MKNNALHTAKKMAIRDSLLALVECARNFRESVIHDDRLPGWIMGNESLEGAMYHREKAAEITTRITYQKEQNRQETTKCAGIMGISSTTFDFGKALNKSKDQFKKHMLDYRSEFGHSFSMTGMSSKELRETLLGKLNLQHLHFVQAYRHIKIFENAPLRVGFSWASAHTGTVRLTAEKAISHLRGKFTPSTSVEMDIDILQTLPMHTEVIIKRPLSPHLRANLTWPDEIEELKKHDPEIKKICPAQINTPLPLFILLEEGKPLPEFNRIAPLNMAARQDRLQRKDALLRKLSEREGSLIYVRQ